MFEVCKYTGRTYCGNAFFNSFDECIKFANDGFCDKAIITGNFADKYTGESEGRYIVKFKAWEVE